MLGFTILGVQINSFLQLGMCVLTHVVRETAVIKHVFLGKLSGFCLHCFGRKWAFQWLVDKFLDL